ncbi:unnamed protein product [Nesidiocoris tenuis]|uniref:Uncharacterized protein n=1 Tax=Nesidiocoris tenuis TaxID=355587 RepID=A0A6H5G229_9HEMI|nr:unnamed protein product [Nesidiocoris tenuis]
MSSRVAKMMPISRNPRPGSAKITEVTSSSEKRRRNDKNGSRTFSPVRLKNFFNRIAGRVKLKNSRKKRKKHRVTIDLDMNRPLPDLEKFQNEGGRRSSKTRRPRSFDSVRSQKMHRNRRFQPDRASNSEKSNYDVNRPASRKIRFKTKIGKIISIKRKPRRAKSKSLYSVSHSLSTKSSTVRRPAMRKRFMHPLRNMRKTRMSREVARRKRFGQRRRGPNLPTDDERSVRFLQDTRLPDDRVQQSFPKSDFEDFRQIQNERYLQRSAGVHETVEGRRLLEGVHRRRFDARVVLRRNLRGLPGKFRRRSDRTGGRIRRRQSERYSGSETVAEAILPRRGAAIRSGDEKTEQKEQEFEKLECFQNLNRRSCCATSWSRNKL